MEASWTKSSLPSRPRTLFLLTLVSTEYGGPEEDSVEGGPGNDQLIGKSGNDGLLGGFDDDLIVGDPSSLWQYR
jgi:hypothetical protein